jgi:hypothetical protein
MGKKKTDPVQEAARVLGSKGGRARAGKLSAKRRKEIAEQGARTRWGTRKRAPGQS